MTVYVLKFRYSTSQTLEWHVYAIFESLALAEAQIERCKPSETIPMEWRIEDHPVMDETITP